MAIGAFIGWQGDVSLMASSIIGSVVGVTLIVMRRSEWSSKIPYVRILPGCGNLDFIGQKLLAVLCSNELHYLFNR